MVGFVARHAMVGFVARHAMVGFVARHAMVTKVRGKSSDVEGHTVINRTDFGLPWNAPLGTGGVLVSEQITVELAKYPQSNPPTPDPHFGALLMALTNPA